MEKITLRAPEPDDIGLIYIWENSTDERHSSLRSGPLSRHSIERFVNEYDGEIYTLGALRYMIDLEGETVGTVDIFDFDHHARHAFVGIYVASAYRRKGIALTALKKVEELMRTNVSMHSLGALVATDNKPSLALFEKAGYRSVGILEGWIADGEERIPAIIWQHIL